MTIVRRSFRLAVIAVLVATAGALANAPAASASCAPPPPLEQAVAQAGVVFVGTVESTEHGGLTATFRVHEVWKGEVGRTAVVHGGPGITPLEDAARKGLGVASSVDRTYTAGTRYLVVSHDQAEGVLRDNICSSTQTYTDELASSRPPTAHPPLEGTAAAGGARSADDGGQRPLLWALLAAFGVLVLLTIFPVRLRAGRAA
jgi:hypothetical protein